MKAVDKNEPRTIVVYMQDKPGVLNRVVSLFRRRAFNIDSLNVGQTHLLGVSRMTVTMPPTSDDTAARIVANLYKLVNVIRVEDISRAPSVNRGMALIKVTATTEQRQEVLQLCEVFRARVIDIDPGALIVEITGTADKIVGLRRVLEPFGIAEMVQTGVLAMTRSSDTQTHHKSVRHRAA